ncbi:uncharacterized protein B0P05DRAFT_549105 [Gilbertella persicaria]|uniref:uncharacterized protein n=1 Tax=Gilbertella persicaria TaxID=101096 RepID=UPI00221F0A3A|nr:uncharacterized protein B0P05DRAFT_549105 [Gilbertella persicaria]KAI8072157.1 hypothetical protein B0P05DRAFT_549105 [Gilbertella persicaria]
MANKDTQTNKQRTGSFEGLPPIQLPAPVVHYYVTPTPMEYHHQVPWQPFPPSPPQPTNKMAINQTKENSRKSSHSAVEKRRRERMNDKIEKLKTLIPSCTAQFPTSVQQPIHKLSVLQAAIDYINELHHQLEASLPEDDPLVKDISIVSMYQKKKQDRIKSGL